LARPFCFWVRGSEHDPVEYRWSPKPLQSPTRCNARTVGRGGDMTESAAEPVRAPMTLAPPSPAPTPKSRRRRGSPTPPAASPGMDPEGQRAEVRQRARIVRTKDGLTYREMTFLRYFLDLTNERTCWNTTQSGLAAGIARTPHAAHVEGSKLLRRPAV